MGILCWTSVNSALLKRTTKWHQEPITFYQNGEVGPVQRPVSTITTLIQHHSNQVTPQPQLLPPQELHVLHLWLWEVGVGNSLVNVVADGKCCSVLQWFCSGLLFKN